MAQRKRVVKASTLSKKQLGKDLILVEGELKAVGRGRVAAKAPLLQQVGQKLPWDALQHIPHDAEGVYILFDSRGWPYYVGRGKIKERLNHHAKTMKAITPSFSFYAVQDKANERQLETLLIRVAAPLLEGNSQLTRRRDVTHFEVGTKFLQVQRRRGRKKTG